MSAALMLPRASKRGSHAQRGVWQRGAAAFTLIEVTMAAAILAVGAAGVLAAYSTTMGIIEHQRRLATAVNVTASKLEDLLVAAPVSALLTSGTNGPEMLDGLGRPPAIGNTDIYDVRWQVTPNVPAPGYLQIIVTTQWVELRGARFTSFAAYRPAR